MKNLIFVCILIATSFSFAGISCRDVPVSVQIQNLKNIVGEDQMEPYMDETPLAYVQTLFVNRLEKSGHIVFTKGPYEFWKSIHNLREGGETPQGDLRWLIALVGPKVAAYLGFRVEKKENGTTELWAPRAQLLKEKILSLNKALKAQGDEPIPFLPVATGFVTSRELLEVSVKSQNDILMSFPFDDKSADLAPHEVAFHLGPILYTHAQVASARLVNLRTLQLAKQLSKYPAFHKVVEVLIDERAYEMDVGTGVPTSALGLLRVDNQMGDYSTLLSRMDQNAMVRSKQALGYFTKSYMAAVEAVIQRIYFITGTGFDFITSELAIKLPQAILTDEGKLSYGPKVQLSHEESVLLTKELKAFSEKFDSDRKTFKPDLDMTSTAHQLQHLGRRIEQLDRAVINSSATKP